MIFFHTLYNHLVCNYNINKISTDVVIATLENKKWWVYQALACDDKLQYMLYGWERQPSQFHGGSTKCMRGTFQVSPHVRLQNIEFVISKKILFG
jgi:hypothetical protein